MSVLWGRAEAHLIGSNHTTHPSSRSSKYNHRRKETQAVRNPTFVTWNPSFAKFCMFFGRFSFIFGPHGNLSGPGLTLWLVRIRASITAASVQHLFGDTFDAFIRQTTRLFRPDHLQRRVWQLLSVCRCRYGALAVTAEGASLQLIGFSRWHAFTWDFIHVPVCVRVCAVRFWGRQLEAFTLENQQMLQQKDDQRLICGKKTTTETVSVTSFHSS